MDMHQTDLERDALGVEPKLSIATDRLRSIVERIERLEEEKKAITADVADIYTEAKSASFDPKVVRQVVKLRKMDPAEAEQQTSLLDLYLQALG